MAKVEGSKIKSVLRNEEVIVRYIRDNSRYNGRHLLAGGLHRDGGRILTIRRQNGRIIPFLTQDEIASLSQELGTDISYSNKEFWDNPDFEVKLINGDIRLNLQDPMDYIKWKFLQKYDMLISPNWDERESMATYKWSFVNNSEDIDSLNQELDAKVQIWMEFGKISNNLKVLSYLYYRLENKIIDPNTKLAVVKGWFKDVIDKKGVLFLKYVQDPLLEAKVLVFFAKRANLIVKRGDMLYYEDTKLSDNATVGSDDNAAEFISLQENQNIKFELQAKLNVE